MAGLKLNSCCFYWDLKTGGIIIGWICAIFGVLGLFGFTYAAFLDSNQHFSVGSIIFTYLVLLCSLAVDVLLIIGASQSRSAYVFPWLVAVAIGIILPLITAVITLTNILGAIISVIIPIYFWVCIYSLYVELKGGARSTNVV